MGLVLITADGICSYPCSDVLMICQEKIPPQIIYHYLLSQGSPSSIQSHADQRL